MTNEIRETWTWRDRPLLFAILRRLDGDQDIVDVQDLETDTGLDRDDVWKGLRALDTAQPPYIEFEGGTIMVVTERGRRELGSWPSAESLVDAIAEALAQAAESEDEPERKKRLRTVAEGLGSFGRDVAVGVMQRFVAGQAGL